MQFGPATNPSAESDDDDFEDDDALVVKNTFLQFETGAKTQPSVNSCPVRGFSHLGKFGRPTEDPTTLEAGRGSRAGKPTLPTHNEECAADVQSLPFHSRDIVSAVSEAAASRVTHDLNTIEAKGQTMRMGSGLVHRGGVAQTLSVVTCEEDSASVTASTAGRTDRDSSHLLTPLSLSLGCKQQLQTPTAPSGVPFSPAFVKNTFLHFEQQEDALGLEYKSAPVGGMSSFRKLKQHTARSSEDTFTSAPGLVGPGAGAGVVGGFPRAADEPSFDTTDEFADNPMSGSDPIFVTPPLDAVRNVSVARVTDSISGAPGSIIPPGQWSGQMPNPMPPGVWGGPRPGAKGSQSSSAKGSSPPGLEVLVERRAQDVVDTRVLGTAPSKGSMKHPDECKPCAFTYKICSRGQDCEFCHLCDPGEKKRQRKDKRRQLAEDRAQTTAPATSQMPFLHSPWSPVAPWPYQQHPALAYQPHGLQQHLGLPGL